jgi:hypothetical protein
MFRILFFVVGMLFSNIALAGDDDPYPLSADEIFIVQQQLYNLNYDVGSIDSKLGERTRGAITEWQTHKKMLATGFLTLKQYQQLKAVDTSVYRWGAVGGSTDGAYSSVWDQDTRAVAEEKAMAGCRSNSTTPEKCTLMRVFDLVTKKDDEGWIAFVHCEKKQEGETKTTTFTDASLVARPAKDDAIKAAFAQSLQDGFVRSSCKLRTVIEALGRHQK